MVGHFGWVSNRSVNLVVEATKGSTEKKAACVTQSERINMASLATLSRRKVSTVLAVDQCKGVLLCTTLCLALSSSFSDYCRLERKDSSTEELFYMPSTLRKRVRALIKISRQHNCLLGTNVTFISNEYIYICVYLTYITYSTD